MSLNLAHFFQVRFLSGSGSRLIFPEPWSGPLRQSPRIPVRSFRIPDSDCHRLRPGFGRSPPNS